MSDDMLDCEKESPFMTIARQVGELVCEKNRAYGGSFEDAPKLLLLLYPDGVKPAQYQDMLLLVRIFDKMKRIATDRDAFGESPYHDIAGYGILGVTVKNK
jgi:hypothetical protein